MSKWAVVAFVAWLAGFGMGRSNPWPEQAATQFEFQELQKSYNRLQIVSDSFENQWMFTTAIEFDLGDKLASIGGPAWDAWQEYLEKGIAFAEWNKWSREHGGSLEGAPKLIVDARRPAGQPPQR
jgi:hypothetical protein